jgi:hypothetical protein
MIIRYDSVAFNVCALCKYWSACNDMWSQMFENLTLCACSVDQNKPQEYVALYIVHAHMFMYTRIELARLCLDDITRMGCVCITWTWCSRMSVIYLYRSL